MEREERKELLVRLEETQAALAKLGRNLKATGELLQRLGGALASNPGWLIFSNRSGFTFTAGKIQAPSFDFSRLPDYGSIADSVMEYQQLVEKESELKRKLGK